MKITTIATNTIQHRGQDGYSLENLYALREDGAVFSISCGGHESDGDGLEGRATNQWCELPPVPGSDRDLLQQ